MTSALFPGSFDPITNGHLAVLRDAARIFDKVYLVVMTNTYKKYLFTSTQRAAFAREAVRDLANVVVLVKSEMLTTKLAQSLQVSTILRGVRNTADFLYEQQIAGINKRLAPEIATVLLFTDPANSVIASSMIKEIASFGGDVSSLVPTSAAKALRHQLGEHDDD